MPPDGAASAVPRGCCGGAPGCRAGSASGTCMHQLSPSGGHGGTSTIYGMKTTLYLPDDVKRAVELEARRRGVSEAEVVRDVLRTSLMSEPVRPRGGIIAGREPIAERVDELLAEGFGR